MRTQYLDHPPADRFVLDVMKKESRKWDWVALMIDIEPEIFKSCAWVKARSALFRIPGKHRNRDLAWDALEEVIATRHWRANGAASAALFDPSHVHKMPNIRTVAIEGSA
jgi:hypothetical protein